MSVVGFVSPSNAYPCGNCGNEHGHNHIEIDASAFAKTPPRTLADGGLWSADATAPDVYVCDICLWSALRGAFGHLLKAQLDATV